MLWLVTLTRETGGLVNAPYRPPTRDGYESCLHAQRGNSIPWYEIGATHKGSEGDFLMTMESALNRSRQSHSGKAEADGVALLKYFRAKGRQ